MKTLSFNPLINLSEEGKRLKAVTRFEATNSDFKITGNTTVFQLFY